MNSFGRLFRVSIFGESHGELAGVLIDGCPAGLGLAQDDFLPDLERRKSGSKGTTTRREPDIPLIKTGVMNGKTTGAPVLIFFQNTDIDSGAYDQIRYLPRPGHADFAAFKKYGGFNDHRGGGHFSGRLTAGLVAAGVIAKKLIEPVRVGAEVIEAGGSREIEKAIDDALRGKDSVGGVLSCRATGLPVGLGEPFFDSVESLISHMVFSVPGVKGIEFGAGFAGSAMRGSDYNDVIINSEGRTKTNNAGGINGGLTNGNEIIFRAAVRPTASIPRPQSTIDLRSGKSAPLSLEGRHDTCIALRMPVIIEAVTAIVLADLLFIHNSLWAIDHIREDGSITENKRSSHREREVLDLQGDADEPR
ncbi:MAG: chorismate synthase [Deltaproteobacteria bacterium]|nr:chorismate synthase [Deltaproteobacteria bacterium]